MIRVIDDGLKFLQDTKGYVEVDKLINFLKTDYNISVSKELIERRCHRLNIKTKS
jgi:hypothetical protein